MDIFIINIDTAVFWEALSSIGTFICSILALWGNPNLFRKWFIRIKNVKILPFNSTALCVEAILSNNSNFNIAINQIIFLFGKNKKILVFGRDNNDILPMGSPKTFIFHQVQTSGKNIYDKTMNIKKLDSIDTKYATVYVETSFGSYHRKLRDHELTDSVDAYKKIINKR